MGCAVAYYHGHSEVNYKEGIRFRNVDNSMLIFVVKNN